MMKFKLIAVYCIGVGAMVAGCASPGPGDKFGDIPPRLVEKNGETHWDNPEAFGPVPGGQQQFGDQTCSKLDKNDTKHIANGYHPRALDCRALDGKALEGKCNRLPSGGFHCIRK